MFVDSAQSIVKVAKEWHAETTQVCADGAPVVSLNKLESLIAEGEKIPVEFSEVSSRCTRQANLQLYPEIMSRS